MVRIPIWRRLSPAGRGQVGIGTLIVFIAMVLVAAISAGVLITSAGALQSSSEATSQEASDSTTSRIEVVGMTGSHFTSDNEIGVVNITIRRAPGAGNIDLRKSLIQWVGPSGVYYQLAAGGATGNPDGRFTVTTIQDEDGSNPVLNERHDRYRITLDLGSTDVSGTTAFGQDLSEGETAALTISTPAGGLTKGQVNAPKTVSGESAVDV